MRNVKFIFKTLFLHLFIKKKTCLLLGRVAQSVTCLATDAYLTADPGVAARSHTFVEIDHQ